MKEKIEDIAKAIQRHREQEISLNISNEAIGRSDVIYANKDLTFWIVNKENKGGSVPSRDINNNVIGTKAGNKTTLKTTIDKPIYKNTKIGEILILNHQGKHSVKAPKGILELEIFNRATYKTKSDTTLATDIQIRIAKDKQSYFFENIAKILKIQKEIDDSEKELKEATKEEAKVLRERIIKKEKEKKALLDKTEHFIRKATELRYQPILDPVQERVKRSKIFDGTLIINGGPGTGKTTALIQRIKFLISDSIEEYYPTLNLSQKKVLFDEDKSWIFFSPSELLRLFLKNSMVKEGLKADNSRVKVWNDYKTQIITEYRFVNPATKGPFLVYRGRNKTNSLFKNNSINIKHIIKEFGKFYVNIHKDKFNRIIKIDTTSFEWREIGNSIKEFLSKRIELTNIDDLINIYIKLHNDFQQKSLIITEGYYKELELIASEIQVAITKDVKRKEKLYALLEEWNSNSRQQEDDIDEDDTENEESLGAGEFDFEKKLFSIIKTLCRKQALKIFDDVKFSKRNREILNLIPELQSQPNYKVIGETVFFKNYFENIIKGIETNLLRDIPTIYKNFRKTQLNLKSEDWNLEILEDIVNNKDKNKRLHVDEQSLLIAFTNTLATKIHRINKDRYKAANHSYIKGFKGNCKSVIGIDEATDFAIIDLIAMNSLKNPEISSVTLSGDIMQRITSIGLHSWEDFTDIVPNSEVKDLVISYRQSPTLLSIAKTIYEKATNKIANYKSYMEKDSSEPIPLIFTSSDEDEKIEWIADRIVEIHKTYGGFIPSIAIFLAEESQLEIFSDKLGEIDALADVGIHVKACPKGRVLGDKNPVRVFSIDYIKGLEFESVFFHNIDELHRKNIDNGLFMKYLYVGLSRATFYLGLTTSRKLSGAMSFIEKEFDESGKTWKL